MLSNDLNNLVISSLHDSKGKDILSFPVSKLTTITDYMVFCSGTSTRHVKSIANNLVTTSKEHSVKPLGTEGELQGEWVLVDLGDVVVHIMLPTVREFYQLEKLWMLDASSQSSE